MAGDSVQNYVYRQYKKATDPIPTIIELLIILRKAASGLKFLHHHGLVHRDIACRNILLGKIQNDRIETSTEIRISDFGLTRKLNGDEENAQKTQSTFGPLKWMAPESIKQKLYSKKSDVYMFGITMYELFYGMEPYLNRTAVEVAMGVVVNGQRPKIFDNTNVNIRCTEMPDAFEQLMRNCWAQKAKQRPSFSQIINYLVRIQANPSKRAP